MRFFRETVIMGFSDFVSEAFRIEAAGKETCPLQYGMKGTQDSAAKEGKFG